MNKYVVIKPLSQVTPEKGFQSFTIGDLVELEEKDAERMIEAGIVEAKPSESPKDMHKEPAKSRDLSGIETANVKPESVEKAVKRGGKEK